MIKAQSVCVGRQTEVLQMDSISVARREPSYYCSDVQTILATGLSMEVPTLDKL